jgi:hypothetical protein
MKIKSIHLNNLRNDGHFQFMQFVVALIRGIGAAVLKVEKQFATLEALHAQEEEAFRKITRSALTVRINEADRERNEVFRSMANAIRTWLTHFNPALREAATRLQIVMDAYGNVTLKSHIAETSAIHNLTQELAGNHAGDVKTTGLDQWITELNRRNAAVQTLLEQRADESAARTPLVLKDVRVKADEAYHALARLIDALATVARAGDDSEAAAMYHDLTGRLNQRIDLLNNALSQRRGHARKTAGGGEEK